MYLELAGCLFRSVSVCLSVCLSVCWPANVLAVVAVAVVVVTGKRRSTGRPSAAPELVCHSLFKQTTTDSQDAEMAQAELRPPDVKRRRGNQPAPPPRSGATNQSTATGTQINSIKRKGKKKRRWRPERQFADDSRRQNAESTETNRRHHQPAVTRQSRNQKSSRDQHFS